MNRNIGFSAGMLALVAFVFHVAAPPASEGGSVEPPNNDNTNKVSPKKGKDSKNSEALPAPIEGPWLATRHFFGSLGPYLQDPDDPDHLAFTNTDEILSCAFGKELPNFCPPSFRRYFGIEDATVDFLVATVPDPMHTRLALFTDSAIDSIEKAADAADWEFVAQWLPWGDVVDSDEKDPSERREARKFIRDQESQPGVLVFRPSPKGKQKQGELKCPHVLLIFLVGETPTAGVNPTQFRLARAYMRSIGDRDEIRIVGPTFSGSFYSLARLIEKDKDEDKKRKVPGWAYVVRSGDVSSQERASWFLEQTRADFHGTGENGKDHYQYFDRTLCDLGIRHEEAAVLVEDESGFGRSVTDTVTGQLDKAPACKSKADTGPVRLFRFPRDISHLRNAYREVKAANQGKAPAPDVEFSLKDPETGEDGIPVFSKAQTPLSENSVLNSIMSEIQRERIRIVQVEATNVLDLLFLARVLRRQCPDTRLMISAPDLLFVEAAQNEHLTGILALSSYPVSFSANQWMGDAQAALPAIHASVDAEGIFNAGVLLLTRDWNKPDRSMVLNDYHWQNISHSPVWLLTLDRQGFSPVRVWEHSAEEEKDDVWFEPVPSPSVNLRLPRPPPIWTFLSNSLALLIGALGTWVVCLLVFPNCSVDARLEILTSYSSDEWREFYIFLAFWILATVQIVLCLPAALSAEWKDILLPLLSILCALALAVVVLSRYLSRSKLRSVVVILALTLRSCVPWLRFQFRPEYASPAPSQPFRYLRRLKLQSLAMVLALAFGSCGLVLWFWCCYKETSASQSFFFSYRAIELRAGSSPLWPVLASAAALLILSLVHLTRLYLSAYQRPKMVVSALGALQPRLEDSHDKLNRSLECLSGLSTIEQKLWFLGLFVSTLLVAWVFRAQALLTAIDSWQYNLVSIALQAAVITALLMTCWHITTLWRSLQSLLVSLATLPLQNRFIEVNTYASRRPIWVRRLNLQSLEVNMRAALMLHDMSLQRPTAPTLEPSKVKQRFESYRQKLSDLLAPDPRSRAETFKQFRTLRRLDSQIAQALYEEVIFPRWLKNPLLDGFESKHPTKVKSEQKEPGRQGETVKFHGDPSDAADLAETFVALHYSSFLLYGVRQIRNLMWFPSLGFVLLMISMNSYSPQSPKLIGRFLFWRCS